MSQQSGIGSRESESPKSEARSLYRLTDKLHL
jgi:hypothetical protein